MSRKSLQITLRITGLAALLGAALFNQARVGDLFFRSDTFSPDYVTHLLILRILAAVAGIGLIIGGGRAGTILYERWDTFSEPAKLAFLTLFLAFCGFVVFSISFYLRDNMVLIENITPYQARFKVLGLTLVIQSDEFKTSDFITCFFFALAGTVCFVMYSLHRLGIMDCIRGRINSSKAMWLIFALGFYFLAMDEYFGIHELIGDNLSFIDKIKITHHPDDMVIGSYFFIALAIILRFRNYLLSYKPGLIMLLTGMSLHALAVASDSYLNFYFFEEGVEELGMIFYFGAMAQYAMNEILALRDEIPHHT